MSSNSAIEKVVSQFLDLALKYKWNEVEKLAADEVQVLLGLVRAAGFKVEAVVFGRLRGDYLEQDGISTGATYPINSFCPFKVTNESGGNHYLATGWLDCALKLAVRRAGEEVVEDADWRQDRIYALVTVIKESLPLIPVQLTPEGDLLEECPPSLHFGGLEYFVKHSRDEDQITGSVGVHKYCGGWMNRNRATENHDSIICSGCHLRVLFPKEVRTYGDLREALTPEQVRATT